MEPVQMFAATIAGFCVKIGIPQRVAESFMLLSVSAFLMTTIDSGTRLARFSWQELIGSVPGSGKAKAVAHNMYFGTLIVVLLAAGLLLGATETSKQLWTIFASANQLLAALTLLSATLWFARNRKPCWMTAIPMALMLCVSSWALLSILRSAYGAGQWVRFSASAFLLMLAVALVALTVRRVGSGARSES
jgi:carbon starvation protein